MSNDRTMLVRTWIVDNLKHFDDAGALQIACIEHFNAIKDFWRQFMLEQLGEMVRHEIGGILKAGRQGRGPLARPRADAGAAVTPASAAETILFDLRSRMQPFSLDTFLATVHRRPRSWQSHYEHVGERRRVLVLEMSRADVLAAAALRRTRAGTDAAFALHWEAVASLLRDGQKVGDVLTFADLDAIWFEAIGAEPATEANDAGEGQGLAAD